jgi:hypothetical protein
VLHLSQQYVACFGLGAGRNSFRFRSVSKMSLQKRSNERACRHQKVRGVLAEISGRRAVDLENTPGCSIYEDRHVGQRYDSMIFQELGAGKLRLRREVGDADRLSRPVCASGCRTKIGRQRRGSHHAFLPAQAGSY